MAKPTVKTGARGGVELDGSEVRRVTGHNAAYIRDNRIGPGAILRIVKSGGVIPYVEQVVKQAKKPQMPDESYVWDATETNVLAVDDSHEQSSRALLHSITVIGLDNFGSAQADALVSEGYETIGDVLSIKPDKLIDLVGVARAKNIRANLRKKVDEADLVTLMMASNAFGIGFGKRRFQALLTAYPDIATMNPSAIKDLDPPHGFSQSTMDLFADGVVAFRVFARNLKVSKERLTFKAPKPKKGSLSGNVYLFTGFRDAALKAMIEGKGGAVADSMNSSVTHVIAKNVNDNTTKLKAARAKGLKIITKEDLL